MAFLGKAIRKLSQFCVIYVLAENASEQNCHCDGKTVEEMKCNTQPCLRRAQRYRCGWSQWSEWCGCSEACDTVHTLRIHIFS